MRVGRGDGCGKGESNAAVGASSTCNDRPLSRKPIRKLGHQPESSKVETSWLYRLRRNAVGAGELLNLNDRVERLGVQRLVAKAAVEAFAVDGPVRLAGLEEVLGEARMMYDNRRRQVRRRS